MKNRRNYETNQEPATLAEGHAPVRAAVKDSAEKDKDNENITDRV